MLIRRKNRIGDLDTDGIMILILFSRNRFLSEESGLVWANVIQDRGWNIF